MVRAILFRLLQNFRNRNANQIQMVEEMIKQIFQEEVLFQLIFCLFLIHSQKCSGTGKTGPQEVLEIDSGTVMCKACAQPTVLLLRPLNRIFQYQKDNQTKGIQGGKRNAIPEHQVHNHPSWKLHLTKVNLRRAEKSEVRPFLCIGTCLVQYWNTSLPSRSHFIAIENCHLQS